MIMLAFLRRSSSFRSEIKLSNDFNILSRIQNMILIRKIKNLTITNAKIK